METLVLSAAFEPVARVPWKRAITLLFEGKVEVVDSYEDRLVRSVTLQLRMPSVVRFVRHVRTRRKGLRFSRENVFARDGGRCQYCGERQRRHEFTFDHVVPRAKGGRTSWENVVVACAPCNRRKADKAPHEVGMRLRAVPTRPRHLPEHLQFVVGWERGVHPTWRQWLRDVSYWHGELEQDG